MYALSILFIVSSFAMPCIKCHSTDSEGDPKNWNYWMCAQFAINNLMQSDEVTEKAMFNAAKKLEEKAKATDGVDTPFYTEGPGDFHVEVLIEVLKNYGYHASYITKALDEYFTNKDLVGFLVYKDYHWFCLGLVHGKWFEMNKNPYKPKWSILEEYHLMANYPARFTMLSVTKKSSVEDEQKKLLGKFTEERERLGLQIDNIWGSHLTMKEFIETEKPTGKLLQRWADKIRESAEKLLVIRKELDEAQRQILEEMAELDTNVDSLNAARIKSDKSILKMHTRMVRLHQKIQRSFPTRPMTAVRTRDIFNSITSEA